MDGFTIVYDEALIFSISPISEVVLTVHIAVKFCHLKINGKLPLVATGSENVILQIYTTDQNIKFHCWIH